MSDQSSHVGNSASMRVALVSKTNGCVGGASYFAENLGGWLTESGYEAIHFCVEPHAPLRSYQRHLGCRKLLSRAVRYVNWRARRLGMVEPLPWEYWFGLRAELSSFDVFHFHDLYMSISPTTLSAVSRHRPILFTVHDCSAFTGGCINPTGCRRFEVGCRQCPKRRELGALDFTSGNHARMRRLALSQRITYVCPSKWIQSEAAKSLDASVRIDHVANGFDLGVYQFRPRDEARRLLGLPTDGKIVAICCGSFENKIKGMPFAFDALRANSDLAITALLIGRLDSKIQNSLSQVKCITPGFVTDRVQLGLLLSSADVLLHPSLGDNLPITIQESMAAGTPVLAFDVGGVPELVRDGQTGWLVPVGNQNALNSALRRVLESGETALYGARARDFIANEYSAKTCVDRHLELYESSVRSWRAETAEP